MATITLVTKTSAIKKIIIDETLRQYTTFSKGTYYPVCDVKGKEITPSYERISCSTSFNEIRFEIDENNDSLYVIQTCEHEPRFGLDCTCCKKALAFAGIEHEHLYDPTHPCIHLLLPDGFAEPLYMNLSQRPEILASL